MCGAHQSDCDVYLVELKVALVANVPVLGRLTLPLEERGEIPIPHKPDVDLVKVVWDHLSMEETAATLHLSLKNLNHFDIGTLYTSSVQISIPTDKLHIMSNSFLFLYKQS